jgi:hypothetical protein
MTKVTTSTVNMMGLFIIFRGSSFTKEACKLWRKRDLSNSEIFLLRFIFGCYLKSQIIGYRPKCECREE